jgi:hypothetical protein
MDNQVICYITNTQGSNNYTNTPEDYMEFDYSIPSFRIKQSVITFIDSSMRHVCDTVYPNPLDSSIVNISIVEILFLLKQKQNLLTIRFSTIVFSVLKDTKFIN